MVKQKLEELLEQLHAELGDAESLDEQSRQRLRAMAHEIESAVGPEEDTGLAADTLSQLEETALSIESEYPRLSAVIGNIADTLAKLGI